MSVSHETQLPTDGKIWIRYKITDGEFGLVRASAAFYNKSRYCQKMYVALPVKQILQFKGALKYSLELSICSEHRVLVLPFPKSAILRRRIKSFEAMHSFMLMVEELQLEVAHLRQSVSLTGWLIELSKMFDDQLKANAKLFDPIDYDFGRMHFPAAQPANNNEDDDSDDEPNLNAQNYEMPEVQPKDLKIAIPFSANVVSQQIFNNTVALCMANGLESVAVMIVSVFLKSMTMSHLALKFPGLAQLFDSHVVELMDPMFIAWRSSYLMEYQHRHLAEKQHPYLFTETDIQGLPKMEVNGRSPYISILNKEHLSLKSQLIAPVALSGARGVYPLKKFKSRLVKFTGGCLAKLDWNNTALCGSTIAACLIQNPLETCFETTEDFWEEYYPKNYVQTTQKIVASLFYQEAEDKNATESRVFDGTDIDLMVESSSLDEFDGIAKSHFVSIREASPKHNINLVRVETPNKHKWRIEGLDRNIEIFHVENIAAVIGKFHLGCVRAWYDGTHTWMFSSFLTAALTGINVDMRWVSCEKDLRDIVLRYYQRGFCTLLNKRERKNILEYVRASPKWPSPPAIRGWRARRNGLGLSSNISHVNKALFHPRSFGCGIWHGRPKQVSPASVPVKEMDKLRQQEKHWKSAFRRDKNGRFRPKFLEHQ